LMCWVVMMMMVRAGEKMEERKMEKAKERRGNVKQALPEV
jgi:hypothetical protein